MSTPEEIRYDGQQQDREDKRREMLERRARMGGPDVEDCETCEGKGKIVYSDTSRGRGGFAGQTISSSECPRCLGTGAQP